MRYVPDPVGPLVAIGASSLIWQVASARAVLAGLYGNELTVGLVLASWLVLMGLATALSSSMRICKRHPRALLAWALSLLPASLLISLALQQSILPIWSSVGQVAGPGRALLTVVACLLPPCLMLGGAFGLISLMAPGSLDTGSWSARIYMVESLGTAGAGVLFHFGLAQMSLSVSAVVAGSLCWLAALLLVISGGTADRRQGTLMLVTGAIALAYCIPGVPLPGARELEPRMPGYRILERINSRHAALSVLQRADQLLFMVNGQVVFSNQDHQIVESQVHLPLLAHPAPRTVLMIGGGLGGGLAEALKQPVEQIEYVELDPEMVALLRRWGDRSLGAPLRDDRVHLRFGDGRRVVASARGKYDVILVHLPSPSSALINRFYTEEFFSAARRALRPGGLLRLGLEGSETYLGDEMALVHASIWSTLQGVFGNVVALPAQSTQIMAGRDRAVDLSFVTLVRRLNERGINTRFFGETELMKHTLPLSRELYLERLAGLSPLHNTDLQPAVYFHGSLLWLSLGHPGVARSLGRLAEYLGRRMWLPPAAAFALALLWGLLRRRRVAAGFAIAVAGLSGLALELGFLLAAQEIRGVIYHEIGALFTSFMVGLAIGAVFGRWLVRAIARRALSVAMACCTGAALAGMVTVKLSVALPAGALWLLLVNMVLVGAAVGACYPPAATLLSNRQGASAPGRAYAWDLLGAAVGALLAAGFLLPVLGILGTCLLCAALCLGCTLALAV